MVQKVGVISLGCSKNLVDTEVMLGKLNEKGFQLVNIEEADILILNSCSFIDRAEKETRETIDEMAKLKEGGGKRLVVTGCFPQRYGRKILKEFPEIDGIIGTDGFAEIDKFIELLVENKRVSWLKSPEYVYDHQTPRILVTPSHTAYVKISEGCDNRCSYCLIPYLRGRFRSRPITSIVTEVNKLVEGGVKEIILVSQDTTNYGSDLCGSPKIVDLLKKLVVIDFLEWIRLLYCYPTKIHSELIELMANEPKICHYLDMPIQHIDNEILMKMNRIGDRKEIVKVIQMVREVVPDIVLRTSIVVGFPGETEEKWQKLLSFVAEIKFERMGIFTFSCEEGTRAYNLEGQIPREIKEVRYHQMFKQQNQISRQKNRQLIGKELTVLIDEVSSRIKGRSYREAPEVDGSVFIEMGNKKTKLQPGQMVKVRIKKAGDYDLVGKLIE